MPHGIFTSGHMSQYKIIQAFELNVLDFFLNNNNKYILNNQILGHVVAHHLPSIVTKIFAS
jgi:hypothetical protein